MKTICLLLAGSLMTATAFSQTITISFNGNKDYRAQVDGRSYSSSDYTGNMNNRVSLNNLSAGAHSVAIYKINKRGKSKPVYTSTVNLGYNEEVMLTVNNNGSISREESSSNPAYGNGTYREAVSDVMFNDAYQRVSNQWGQPGKMNEARKVFTTYNNYYTAAQARQIILLINSEANRLELAKLAYDHLVDPSGYTQFYGLLNRQASRNELDAYARNRNYDPNNVDPNYNNGTGSNNNYNGQAMSDASFNNLYESIRGKWLWFTKKNAAKDAFESTTNRFTTSQASKIIALISGESDRLELAKLSYDNIVDPQHFRDIYSLLSNQSSRDELDAYIRANYNNLY